MTMTYAQGMAYELARELISSQIGNVSHEIGIEEKKLHPDLNLVADLETKIIDLGRERECLNPENDSAVDDVIQRYARNPKLIRMVLGALQPPNEP